MQATFDPFADRRARDIRNILTEALVAAANPQRLAFVQRAAQELLSRYPEPVYQDYIRDRVARYRAVWPDLAAAAPSDNLGRALALWRGQLFFEVHAFLEVEWQRTSGTRRRAFQALIQAAAVYVHREFGHTRAAARLADKAAVNLAACRAELTAIANIDDLRRGLADPGATPPVLRTTVAP